MELVDLRTAEALNAMLEQVRASVAMEIALADGATELGEREVFSAMGGQEVGFSVALRERLERLGIAASSCVGATVAQMLDTERYDDRLLAFARHQRATAESARALLPAVRDYELRAVLQELGAAHERDALWCERRAAEFAASRDLDFRTPDRVHQADGGRADVVAPPEVTGETVPDDDWAPPRARSGVGAGEADDSME